MTLRSSLFHPRRLEATTTSRPSALSNVRTFFYLEIEIVNFASGWCSFAGYHLDQKLNLSYESADVFDTTAGQGAVFDRVGMPLVTDLLQVSSQIRSK